MLLQSTEGEFRRTEPSQIVTVSEIQKVGDNAYYPISWTIESKQDDDRSLEARQRVRSQPSPLYTYQFEKWRIEEISYGLWDTEYLSVIGFPKGTLCFDERKNAYFTYGQDAPP